MDAEPPTFDEITRAREDARLQRLDIRRQNIRFLIVILLIVATIMSVAIAAIIPMLDSPGTEPDIVGLFAYLTPYMFLAVFVVGNTMHHTRIEKPRKALEARMKGLVDATPEELAVLANAELPAQALAYRQRIAAQGRAPVSAEVQAMLAPGSAA